MTEDERSSIRKEYASNEVYRILLSNWSTDEYSKVFHYPSYYGGAFIDQTGELNVCSTNAEDADHVRHLTRIAKNINLKVIKVEHSKNKLLEILETISNYMKSNNEMNDLTISSCMISETHNQVIVYMDHCTEENIQLFKRKVSASSVVVFHQTAAPNYDAAEYIKPGQGIAASMNGSMGYPAWTSGNRTSGFVTAGHIADSDTAIVYLNHNYDTRIGQVISGCRQNCDDVDAAFVKIDPSHEAYWKTASANHPVIQDYANIVEGGTLYFEGYASAAKRNGESVAGKINSLHCTVKIASTGLIYTDQAIGSAPPLKGDSGGICYYFDGRIAGIVKGIHDNSKCIISKAPNINYALGIQL